jgi:hypothetical protein
MGDLSALPLEARSLNTDPERFVGAVSSGARLVVALLLAFVRGCARGQRTSTRHRCCRRAANVRQELATIRDR